MAFQSTRNPAQRRLFLLTGILFVSYLCVAMPLPIVPVYVAGQLGLGNVWAGLGVGIAFFATIVTRGYAGNLSDHNGPKVALARGLAFYVAGALTTAASGLLFHTPSIAFVVLLAGRLLLGLGESLVGVGVIAWGVGLVGPARSSRVLALIGAAIYGAFAVGGPIGLALFDQFGFSGAMAISAVLPCLGLLAIWRMDGIAAHPRAERPPFWKVIGKIWWPGAIVGLQGIGFAAIGSFFVLYFLDRHWSYAGLGLTAFGGGFVLVRVLLGHLPDRIGGLPVAIGSLAAEAIGQALIWSAPESDLCPRRRIFDGARMFDGFSGHGPGGRAPCAAASTRHGIERVHGIPGSRLRPDRPIGRVPGRPDRIWQRLPGRRRRGRSGVVTRTLLSQRRNTQAPALK